MLLKLMLLKKAILRCLTLNSKWITEWKSKGLSNERLEVVSITDNTLTLSVNYYEGKVRLRFTGTVLQEKIITCSHKKVVNIYIVYEITNLHNISSYPALENALFGAVKLIRNSGTYK